MGGFYDATKALFGGVESGNKRKRRRRAWTSEYKTIELCIPYETPFEVAN